MCGIAGIVFRDPPGEAAGRTVADMVSILAHRGPDGNGTYLDGPCALGHTRLAILDLSTAGDQPMHTANGRYCITYNGEVYNYRELRAELEQAGYVFASTSDTEVVLNAYAAWGSESVQRFNGMFAFAIWDRDEQTLFLARDRYGIKPLYYASTPDFHFASELKALLCSPSVSRSLDMEAFLEYFTFQNLFTNKTFFSAIKLFPAGHYAKISADRPADIRLTQYWDFDFRSPSSPLSPEEYREELDMLFRQAVERQMVSDVEIGTYLSSGIDSGAISAVAARHRPYIKSFTCGFDLRSAVGLELAFDERAKAEHLSYLFKTEHYQVVLKAGDMVRCLPRLSWHLEEPRVGQSYPNYYAAGLASRFCKVVLTGTGGDEIFGGYPWRYYRTVNSHGFEDYVDRYYQYWQRLLVNGELKSAFAPVWDQVSHVRPRDIFRAVFPKGFPTPKTPEDYVNASLYFEAKTFLHGLLTVEDKLSMAHGLESRVPFLDNDIVDFAMRIPVNLKLGKLDEVVKLDENEPGPKRQKYFTKTRDGKLILRDVLGRYVPSDVSNGVKQGFSGPDASWFKGESIDYVRSILWDDDSRLFSILDRDAVRSLASQHLEQGINRRLLIWSFLMAEHFLQSYA